MTKGQKGGGASSKNKQAKQNELRSTSAPVTSTDRHPSTKTRLVSFTRESETPMHLPRLWTDAPVAKKTQVNSTTKKRGQAGKEEPLIGPDRSKKGPTERTRGAKTGKQEGQKATR